jgi:hypothetical protein
MAEGISGKGTHEIIGDLRQQLAQRKLLPEDVTFEELSWLLDNHAMFHRFVDMIIANAIEAFKRHHRWEVRQA